MSRHDNRNITPMDKIIQKETRMRKEFCVEVTEPLTVMDARKIARDLYNGGVSAAIYANKDGTYTVWRKPFSDEYLEPPGCSGGPIAGCIMRKNYPLRGEFMEVLECE